MEKQAVNSRRSWIRDGEQNTWDFIGMGNAMSVISLFSTSHCHRHEVTQEMRNKLGYDLLSNKMRLTERRIDKIKTDILCEKGW